MNSHCVAKSNTEVNVIIYLYYPVIFENMMLTYSYNTSFYISKCYLFSVKSLFNM